MPLLRCSDGMEQTIGHTDFLRVEGPHAHVGRAKQILSAHPELKKLFGPDSSTFLHILAIVGIQVVLAAMLRDSSWWVILIASYVVGAFANHALWILIHEGTHNLIFKSSAANNAASIVANMPILLPSAISFKKYHLFHHTYLGELEGDADLAWPWEARLVGSSWWKKCVWFLLFMIIEGVIRPIRIKGVVPFCRWTAANWVVEAVFFALMVHFFGWGAIAYLALSTFFSIGLHPVGARWIQEHHIFRDDQDTYSYYGPYNTFFGYNIGHHNEHHDLPVVPWSRLPAVRAGAPEFYDSLYWHPSYTKLLFRFIFDPSITLFSRRVRVGRAPRSRPGREILATEAEVTI
jgi:sphingolipid delta-4 desaturase